MTADERRVLEHGRDRLRGVVRIIAPDGENPISPLVRRAENPALWTGNLQASAVGFLQATEWWVGKPLTDSVEAIVDWLDRRITQLDDQARAVAAGAAMTPPAALPMPPEGPDPPPGAPRSWKGARGFSSMDPAQVKRLCSDMASTADAIARLGRTVRIALQEMAAFLPSHASEAAGLNRFDEVCNVLREVGRDLSNRATRIEEAYVVSAFFGAPLPLLGRVSAIAAQRLVKPMGAVPAQTPGVAPLPRPARAAAGASRPPAGESRSLWSGFFLGQLTRGGISRDERRRALRVLKAACARARRDPGAAADFVNGLGADALGALFGTNDDIRKELGCVLGAASATSRVKFDARAVLLKASERLHWTDTLEILEAGRFDPSWVISFAERFFAVPVPRPTKYYFDMVERTVRLLGRDQATAFAAATDPEIARSLGGLINHTDKGIRRAAEAAARKGLLPPPDDHDQLVAARNGMEAIILRACGHPRPTGSARRLVADFLAVNMGDLAILATKSDEGRLSPDELSLSRKQYEKALVFACKETAGRAAVLASSTAQLADIAGSGADKIAGGLAPGLDLEGVKALARSAASTMDSPLGELGAQLGLLGEVNLEVLDDRKRAAKEIATAIGVAGSILLAGGGMAAGAAGGALKTASTFGGPVASEVVTQLTEALEKRLTADDIKTATDFMDVINATVETVMVVALYNQTDANGGHPFREHMFDLDPKMEEPPKEFLDADGNLVLPTPLTPEAQGRLDDWLKPFVEGPNPPNPLYAVSNAWVRAPGGLSATLHETLVMKLYKRQAKE